MGNYRFRLSDMMPNAWFYKLKDMGRARNRQAAAAVPSQSVKKKQRKSAAITQPPNIPRQSQQNSQLYPRKSYHFTRELGPSDNGFYDSPSEPKSTDTHLPVEPPRKSCKQRGLRKIPNRSGPKFVSSPVSAEPGIHGDHHVVPELRFDPVLVSESFDDMVAWSNSCNSAKDIVIDVDKKPDSPKIDFVDGLCFAGLSELQLPPIITKPAKVSEDVKKKKKKQQKEERITTTKICSMNNSPGVRLRLNSPKIASRKIQGRRSTSSSSSSSSRRSNLSDSFAIVKSSSDPQRDFKDSMVEMIVENKIRASKDLEDLLACYLSLNSDEYHELIIKVFKQIWFDFTAVRLK